MVGTFLFFILFFFLRAEAERTAARDAAREASVLTPVMLPYLVGHIGPEGWQPRSDAQQSLQQAVDLLRAPDVVRVKVWNRNGRILYSDDPSLVGQSFAIEPDLARALNGDLVYKFSDLAKAENAGERSAGYETLLEVYVPIRSDDGSVVGAYELYKSWAEFARLLWSVALWLLAGLALGLSVLYLGLVSLFRNASRRLVWQNNTLEELSDRLRRSLEDSERLFRATVASLCDAVEAKDVYTAGHASRVARIALVVGQAMALGPADLRDLELAALLHDVGKIGTPEAILLKPGRLTEEEWQVMRQHPVTGAQILMRVPGLERVAEAVAQSHEHWDGSGYPAGLKGDAISPLARILIVSDAYDAMTTDRPYRRALSHQEACQELERCAGRDFSPEVIQVFLAHQEEVRQAAGGAARTERAGLPARAAFSAP